LVLASGSWQGGFITNKVSLKEVSVPDSIRIELYDADDNLISKSYSLPIPPADYKYLAKYDPPSRKSNIWHFLATAGFDILGLIPKLSSW